MSSAVMCRCRAGVVLVWIVVSCVICFVAICRCGFGGGVLWWIAASCIAGSVVVWLRPSTAVDKTVFQCTKFWIEKEASMWVVELVSPEGNGII